MQKSAVQALPSLQSNLSTQQPSIAECVHLLVVTLQASVVQSLPSLHSEPLKAPACVHWQSGTARFVQLPILVTGSMLLQASVVHLSPSLQSAIAAQQPFLGAVCRHWLFTQ